jgi:hypothetical protein
MVTSSTIQNAHQAPTADGAILTRNYTPMEDLDFTKPIPTILKDQRKRFDDRKELQEVNA